MFLSNVSSSFVNIYINVALIMSRSTYQCDRISKQCSSSSRAFKEKNTYVTTCILAKTKIDFKYHKKGIQK